MIDLHCHILPGVDDGADSLETALAMAELAAASEIGTLVATPHCNTRSQRKNYRSDALDRRFSDLASAIRQAGIAVELKTGCEVLLCGDVESLLTTRALYTLAGSGYLLVEFYFDEHPRYMDDALRAVRSHGFTPIVAHPERYLCVQDEPSLAARWYRLGYGLQLNKGSILGDLGERAYDTARAFLKQGLCHVIASDAHRAHVRTPSFLRLLDELEYFFPQLDPMLYLDKNPERVIKNRSLL